MQTRATPIFYVLLFGLMIATFALHEGGHWLAASLLGYEPFYGLNGAGTRSVVTWSDKLIIDAAGPVVTVIQGLVAFALVRNHASPTAFAALWCAAFMRLLASLISLVHLNDEARVSLALGLPAFVLPIAVSGMLVGLAVIGGVRMGVSWRAWVLSWVVGSAAVAAIVWLDMALKA